MQYKISKPGGKIIKELREKENLNLEQLSVLILKKKQTLMTVPYLSEVECGLGIPFESGIRVLADVLKYTGDMYELILAFGRIPERIESLIIDNPGKLSELLKIYGVKDEN